MAWNHVAASKSDTAETGLEACEYFVDEVSRDSVLGSQEQVLLLKHRELRKAVIRGERQTVRVLLDALGSEQKIIVNLSPEGANTLLYHSAQLGYNDITAHLLEAGADGRLHAATKYSPLYAAVHRGQYETAKQILDWFPELVQQVTVEGWLPLHAACINGCVKLLHLLLSYQYPDYLYSKYQDDIWEWCLAFDANARDATGQTCLYIASILGNKTLITTLLQWKVKCVKIINTEKSKIISDTSTRRNVSYGIQTIISKLNLSANCDASYKSSVDCERNPIKVNILCGAARETALLAAVRGGFLDVATELLKHGADPNAAAKPVENLNDPNCSEEIYGLSSVPIVEACKQRSIAMVDVLLKYGARDESGLATNYVICVGDEELLSKLLSKRAHPDSDFTINKKSLPMTLAVKALLPASNNLAHSCIFPNIPTIIDWHGDINNQLTRICLSWLIRGVLELNPKLESHPRKGELMLSAITRIDLSHNALKYLPEELFNLISLKHLNLGQNKLSQLPHPKKYSDCNALSYNSPVLEELYLQDNQLAAVHSSIFNLPSLAILDVSNNKLQDLPVNIWKAPKLRELNAAFNLLKELPAPPMMKSYSHRNIDSMDFAAGLNQCNDDIGRSCQALSPHHVTKCNIWSETLPVIDGEHIWMQSKCNEKTSQLSNLNIANNLFMSIPPMLPCLAENLTRLNMSYNSLRTMGYVTSYPTMLKQLDLSHNEISCWPSLPQITESDPNLLCFNSVKYEGDESPVSSKKSSTNKSPSLRASLLSYVCRHRRHLRLDSLRTLILADNLLTRIQLSTDDSATQISHSQDGDWNMAAGVTKSKLIFPNLSMLDISNNCLKEVPSSLHELSNLSVLNVSGNVYITDLPPQIGLLTRLWNLNMRGCMLHDPLKSMTESKKYKTMDIIGYLKSIHEDAQPYARMKLMLVGTHGIGKTTLLNLLRYGAQSIKLGANENHWAKRMGHSKPTITKSQTTGNISTVGVDIGTWICEKRKKGPGYNGPIIFRTWDFGGQNEYYATHQYFLSKRSLYLVMWNITDGQKGLAGILLWLGNIQARAPNTPVIIVGTHFDAVGDTISAQYAEQLQQIIREKFIAIPDAEKVGLPRVIDSIQISCRTKHNIRLLSNIIYDTAFMLRSPGSKEPLLLQKIPASYIALEDVIDVIARNFRVRGLDPVIDGEQYKCLVNEEMRSHNYHAFRDSSELQQATMFLHENGVLLHYDDAILRNYYFLDPQWLCDMLAHVVTVREINPFAPKGVMKLEDLKFVFRSNAKVTDSRCYIVNLLNKFEVALTWDSRNLLIPSLLPMYERTATDCCTKVRLYGSLKCRSSSFVPCNSQYISLTDLSYESAEELHASNFKSGLKSLRRILLLSYFPCGFWARLITRILADEQIAEVLRDAYISCNDVPELNSSMEALICQGAQWHLWQTGLSLYIGSILIFKIWKVPFEVTESTRHFRTATSSFKLKLDDVWSGLDLSQSNILEVYFPLLSVNFFQTKNSSERKILGKMCPSLSAMARLLAIVVDHIDLLLEDWYPSLGTRFVHTSEGRFLITRIVICPDCLSMENKCINYDRSVENIKNSQCGEMGRSACSKAIQIRRTLSYFNSFKSNVRASAQKDGRSEDCVYLSDTDSGVYPDPAGSSRATSTDSNPMYNFANNLNSYYAWLVEDCILSIYSQTKICCPVHSEMDMESLAPDLVFADVPPRYSVDPDRIFRGTLLGRGAFGFVFKAAYKEKQSQNFKNVAMKMLQIVPPGTNAKESAQNAYKVAVEKWDRDPLQHSCKAYCTARQELSVLLSLKHPNIVPLVGICIKPLALVLELAPLGGLDVILRQYRRTGAHFGLHALQLLLLQTARAIEYLHRQHIIYRDLKSENVLVWKIPPPHSEDSPRNAVHIKIADYGISRLASPNGSKGFGGTEGFMAPEIIRFNGEQEYTEKVDCFSFGMFIYENITLHQPFEGYELIKECLLEGNRPPLSQRETKFPTNCLDLMVLCWDELPDKRPSASQIVSILAAPEFKHLQEVAILQHNNDVLCGAFRFMRFAEDEIHGLELWLPGTNSQIEIFSTTPEGSILQLHRVKSLLQAERGAEPMITSGLHSVNHSTDSNIVCCCSVYDSLWMGDETGTLHVYNTSSYTHIYSYIFDSSIRSPVVTLVNLSKIQRVAAGLANGRIFLLDSTKIPAKNSNAEGSFVLTEMSSGTMLFSAGAIYFDSYYELWCGGIAGKINIFSLNGNGVTGYAVLPHNNEYNVADAKVSHMCTSEEHVITSLHPGCIVYQWSATAKELLSKLDCSKLLPCSESLKSIAIEEDLNLVKFQISALAVQDLVLYIGTTWGCLIIAEATTLHPITVFRPYENEVKAIITVPNSSVPLLCTIGRHYRSLIRRYMDDTNESYSDNVETYKSFGAGDSHISKLFHSNDFDSHIHCLIWRTTNWS